MLKVPKYVWSGFKVTTGSGDTAVVTLELNVNGYVFDIVYVKAVLPSPIEVLVFAKLETEIKEFEVKVAIVVSIVVVSSWYRLK